MHVPPGQGEYCSTKNTFDYPSHQQWKDKNIAYLEMWALILALKLWGHELYGKRLVIQCDNFSVVQAATHGRAKDLFLQGAMRELVFLQAQACIEVKVVHLMGSRNSVPDWLSRWAKGGVVRRKFREYAQGKKLTRAKCSSALLHFTHNW